MIAENYQTQIQAQNKQNQLSCQIHKGSPFQFIEVYNKQVPQTAVCCKCVTKFMMKGENLLCIDDVISCESKTVFLNWPFLEKREVLQEYQNIIENQLDDICPLHIINDFFNDMEKQVVEKIVGCKKKILAEVEEFFMTKDKLNSIYNEVSQKELLQVQIKNLCEGNNSLEELDQMINKCKEKYKENLDILQHNLNLYNQSQQILQLKEPQMFLEQILLFIDQIFFNLTSGSNKYLQQSSYYEQIENNQNIVNKIISLINNPSNYCNQDFISQLQKYLNIYAPLFNRINFNEVYNPSKTPIDFSQIKDSQYKNLEIYINQLQKINQISILADDSANQIQQKFKQMDSLLSELNNSNEAIVKYESNRVNEIKKRNNVITDKTQSCYFIKSAVDECSQNYQFISRSENILELKNQRPGYYIQAFYDQIIQPNKKYVIRIQFEPFNSQQKNYEISIGIIQSNKINSNFINASSLCFTNKDQEYFNVVKKGKPFNDASCRHETKMRTLEYQMCLEEKYFQLSDYPGYENITIAGEENLRQLDLNKQYMFGIEYYSIEKIKIVFIAEVLAFVNE
ncbi:ubiquitin family protein (macronuclear) [Tetrahymena thermophila SB210]|uniref:Ubiquitin family protein n=1 Tax=Tetrahymena thermophila (strain SB210) TaxID=312017 RepID=I7M8I6_TETTS|nr:ubiquitin family protein [Tetrahymena thermophila SB210]EAR98250.2 ubiquitin family protein [Tetrahymena thermophila SB210]|eukprot:XP_001018495.2 ubiquitin family protein [Tetrahymena thermophila SB210]